MDLRKRGELAKVGGLLLVALLALIQALTHFGVVYSDSKDYYCLTRFIEGLRSQAPPSNALVARPLLPALAALLDPFLGLPLTYGLLNTLFWLGSALALYFLTREVVKCEESALYAALLLSSCWPMVLYAAASMTEAVGLFASLATLLLAFKLMEERSLAKLIAAGLAAGVLTLAREVVLTSLASVIVLAAWRRRPGLMYFLASWMAVVAAYQLYVNTAFGVNYLTHYMAAGVSYTAKRGLLHQWLDPVVISKAFLLGHVPVAWLALLVGFLIEDRREVLLTFYALFIPCFAAFVLWPFHDLRIAVMCYHATLPMAGVGLKYISGALSSKPWLSALPNKLWAALIIALSVLASNYVVYLDWGQLSTPWDIYMFAPSSLKV